MLTANESFIFDHYENIKYYWDDIEEADSVGRSLQIHLFEPQKYFKEIKSPFYRFFSKLNYKLFKAKSIYTIDLSMLDTDKGELLNTLNDFSIAAEN